MTARGDWEKYQRGKPNRLISAVFVSYVSEQRVLRMLPPKHKTHTYNRHAAQTLPDTLRTAAGRSPLKKSNLDSSVLSNYRISTSSFTRLIWKVNFLKREKKKSPLSSNQTTPTRLLTLPTTITVQLNISLKAEKKKKTYVGNKWHLRASFTYIFFAQIYKTIV